MNSILIKKEPVLLLQSKTQTESSTEENKHANPQTNGAEHKKAFIRPSRGFESEAPNDCFLFREAKILPRIF